MKANCQLWLSRVPKESAQSTGTQSAKGFTEKTRMAYLEASNFVFLFSFVQIAGLASAWLARLSEGSGRQSPCQWLFFGLLAAVGVTTMASIALDTGWLTSGATLAAMVLAAIWDFRAHAPRHAVSTRIA